MFERDVVAGSISAYIGNYSLHNTLFRDAIDIRKSLVNFTTLRAIFKRHYPNLETETAEIDITMLVKVTDSETGATHHEVDSLETSTYRPPFKVGKKRIDRPKPVAKKKKKK